jgi:membrane protein
VSGKGREAGWGGRITAFAIGMAVGLGFAVTDVLSSNYRAPFQPAAGHIKARTEAPRGATPWRTIAWRTIKAFGSDRIPSAAAAITFYMLLAIFPALSAFVSLYGLVADLADARRQVLALADVLPGGAVSILGDELTRLTTTDHGALGLAFAISLATSIWSSNAGAKALIEGLNVAYEKQEKRGFIHLTLLSLSFTVGAIALGVCGVALIVSAPVLLGDAGLTEPVGGGLLRWPAFLALAIALLSIIYRYGPCRGKARWRWITPGSLLAAVGWLAMTGLFSWYVANFGHYNRTYGSLGAIVGFLTWIWMSLMVVLLGAEFNSEIENAARAAAS